MMYRQEKKKVLTIKSVHSSESWEVVYTGKPKMPFANCVNAISNVAEFLIKKRFIDRQASDIPSIERTPLLTCVNLWKSEKRYVLSFLFLNYFPAVWCNF